MGTRRWDYLSLWQWGDGVGYRRRIGLGLTSPSVKVELDGGQLMIDWRDDGAIMTGTVSDVFQGQVDASLSTASVFCFRKGSDDS